MIDKIINLINPENKDLQKMSKDELLELLIKLNKFLRCLDNSENVIAGAMEAGNLVSPTKEVQTKILEYLCENLSKVQDDKVRAAMVYYILLDLHIFNDGNGRTARFMYDLISGDLSEDRIPYYFHKDSNIVKDSQNDLEESKGILDVSYVDQIPDEIIGQQLRFIPTSILEDYFWITVGYTDSSPSTKSIIPKSVLEQLSKKELQDLNQILHDGYGMKLCPSGIAILYVSKRKGQLSTWIDKNTTNLAQGIGLQGRLNFSIYRNPEMIADWTVDDFREVIRVGNTVKYARLKCLIDIFVEPEKYININSGKPYLNEIISNPSEKKVFD